MEYKIDSLTAEDIECRISTVSANGLSLLLYKDARCDMRILDKTFGMMNWKRSHELINGNLFCTVSIYDEDKSEWISKQDVGTESYTEKEKGQASDSFKRACFNIGIGRELYTAPFIWVNKADLKNHEQKNGKWTSTDKFSVTRMDVKDGVITSLVIKNASTGKQVYTFGTKSKEEIKEESKTLVKEVTKKKTITQKEALTLEHMCEADSINPEYINSSYKVSNFMELTPEQYAQVIKNWEVVKSKPNAHISKDK